MKYHPFVEIDKTGVCETCCQDKADHDNELEAHFFVPIGNPPYCQQCGMSELHQSHYRPHEGRNPYKVTKDSNPYAYDKIIEALKSEATPKTKSSNPKDAIGSAKPPLSTISQTVVAELGVAMLEGALKYGRHNYRVIGVRASIYYDACMRHMNKWWEGQDLDPDSGLSHVIKAMASLMVLRDAMIQDMLNDDRPPAAPASFFAELEVAAKDVLARYPEAKAAHTEIAENEKEKT